MSGERKNVAVDIFNFNNKKYGDFRYLSLYKLTEDDVLWVIWDESDTIFYDKILKKPKTASGRTKQRNYVQKIASSLSRPKGSPVYTQMIDSSRTLYELDDYFRINKLYKLVGEYEKELYESKNKDFNEKFKLDHRMKVGETYYIYYPTRGDISEPKSYVAHTFDSLDPLSDGAVYRLNSGGHTLTSINYNKLEDKFLKKEIMTENDYVEWSLNSPKKNQDKSDVKLERISHEFSRELLDRVSYYKEDKTSENRELLKAKIEEFAQLPKMYGNQIIPTLFEANNALPISKRFPMYSLFSPTDSKDLYFINNSSLKKKPVWDYIPKNLIKTINVKPVKYEMYPRNFGLFKIMSLATSSDDLRPAMTGVQMDDDGATATDAHVMLHVAGKKNGKYENGIYPSDKSMKSAMDGFRESIKVLQDKVDLGKAQGKDDLAYNKKNLANTIKAFDKYKQNPIMDERFPNWKAILPKSKEDVNTTRVHLPFLMSVLKTLRDNILINETNYSVELIFPIKKGDNGRTTSLKSIGFNTVLLERLVKAFMMLGIDQVDLNYSEPSKAMVVTRAGDVWDWNNPIHTLTFGLIMPIMLGGYSSEYSSVKIVADNELDIRVGEGQTKTLTYSDFYGVKPPVKTLKKKVTEKDFLTEKIEAFKMMRDIEDDEDEKKFLDDKIKAFELLSDI